MMTYSVSLIRTSSAIKVITKCKHYRKLTINQTELKRV